MNPKTFFPSRDSGGIGKNFISVLGENESGSVLDVKGSAGLLCLLLDRMVVFLESGRMLVFVALRRLLVLLRLKKVMLDKLMRC